MPEALGGSGIFTVDLQRLQQLDKIIRYIERKGGRAEKPLKRWGAYMLQQTGRTFDDAGRGPVRWKPLAAVTLIMRKGARKGKTKGGKTGRHILQDTGHLKRSIRTTQLKVRGVLAQIVYTKVPYARTHQDGGKIDIPRRVITPRKAKALHFFVNGQEVFCRRVVQPAKQKPVPQRKILFITFQDRKRGITLLQGHAAEVAGGAAHAGGSR